MSGVVLKYYETGKRFSYISASQRLALISTVGDPSVSLDVMK